MLREGSLAQITEVGNRSEIVLEGMTPELMEEIRVLAAARGAKWIHDGHPRTTLETLFLEVTSAAAEAARASGGQS
jgi:hypothetical protein